MIVTVVFLDQRTNLIEQRLQIEDGGDILRHVDGGLQSPLDAFSGPQRLFQFGALVLILHTQALDVHVSAAVYHMNQQRYRQGRNHREGEMRPGRIRANQQRSANPAKHRTPHDNAPPSGGEGHKSDANQQEGHIRRLQGIGGENHVQQDVQQGQEGIDCGNRMCPTERQFPAAQRPQQSKVEQRRHRRQGNHHRSDVAR